MTIKELEYALDNYYQHWGLNDAINTLNSLKAAYDALYETGGGTDYSGMPHSPNPKEPPLEAVIRMGNKPEELAAEINDRRAQILKIHDTNRALEQALHKLEPREAEIIHLRHCERMEFKQIARVTHYSENWAKRKYYWILKKMTKMI